MPPFRKTRVSHASRKEQCVTQLAGISSFTTAVLIPSAGYARKAFVAASDVTGDSKFENHKFLFSFLFISGDQ